MYLCDIISLTKNKKSMHHNNLQSALENFHGVTDIKDEKQKMTRLSKQFHDIAEEVITRGCFEINGIRRIYPVEIEFYYHEEGGGNLKDPVMYHTCDNKASEYYELGSLNPHVSGIDVTFENKDKEYRASFLIRAYKVDEFDGEKWSSKKLENRPTYLYEDMFMNLPISNGINVRWITLNTNDSPTIYEKPRVNVAKYQKNGKGKYVKEQITQQEYDNLDADKRKEYFSYSGKKLKRCTRPWRYSLLEK